jgi:hypothetical protein
MSDTKIEISVSLAQEEQQQLAAVLGIDKQELNQRLPLIARAASYEYLRMILGQKVSSRASDIFEYRLLLLVQEVFGNTMPDERTIADLFQMTESRAGALIRAASSKYRFELNQALKKSLVSVLQSVKRKKSDDDWEVTISSRAIVDNLNTLLSRKDGTLPPIKPRSDAVSTFVIKPSAYTVLCEVLEITPKK